MLQRAARLELKVDEVNATVLRKLRNLRAVNVAGTSDPASVEHGAASDPARVEHGAANDPARIEHGATSDPARVEHGAANDPARVEHDATARNLRALKSMEQVPLLRLRCGDTAGNDRGAWPFSPLLEHLLASSRRPPSVTRVLSQTMSAESRLTLERWERRMIKQLGWHGFQDYRKGDKRSCSAPTEFFAAMCTCEC